MKWGNWELNLQNMSIEYFEDGEWLYGVDLEECRTSAEILDWIFQVHTKAWITDKDRGDLLRALKDVLHPQANFCSGGQSKKADPIALARNCEARVARRKKIRKRLEEDGMILPRRTPPTKK